MVCDPYNVIIKGMSTEQKQKAEAASACANPEPRSQAKGDKSEISSVCEGRDRQTSCWRRCQVMPELHTSLSLSTWPLHSSSPKQEVPRTHDTIRHMRFWATWHRREPTDWIRSCFYAQRNPIQCHFWSANCGPVSFRSGIIPRKSCKNGQFPL